MSNESCSCRSSFAYILGILGAFLIVALLIHQVKSLVAPAPLGEDRAALRSKGLMEIRAAEKDALENPAILDAAKGVVRLPIKDAMAIIERDWGKNPAAGRTNLIARVEKATALPPKAPEKPSAFE